MGKGAIVCIMDCTLTPKTTRTKARWRLSREGLDPFTLSQESGFSRPGDHRIIPRVEDV